MLLRRGGEPEQVQPEQVQGRFHVLGGGTRTPACPGHEPHPGVRGSPGDGRALWVGECDGRYILRVSEVRGLQERVQVLQGEASGTWVLRYPGVGPLSQRQEQPRTLALLPPPTQGRGTSFLASLVLAISAGAVPSCTVPRGPCFGR